MNPTDTLRQQGVRAARIARGVGAAGVLASAGLALVHGRQEFLQSYLQAHLFWSAIAVGSLAILMVHHLAGGAWSFVSQRVLEAAAHTIPLLGLLFLPVLFGAHDLYHWTHADAVAKDRLLQHKSLYLNFPFWVARAVLCFAIWSLLAHFLRTWSLRQDRTGDLKLCRTMRVWSGAGLLLYAITITLASWDWTMSLEPHWFSSLWGPMFLVAQGLGALAFLAIVLHWLVSAGPLAAVVKPAQFHSIGNLIFAFTILWIYMAFSQFLIIWSGNLPEEIIWYLQRATPGWKGLAVLLTAFHFFVPFLLLLSRHTKLRGDVLWKIALGILLMRLVDLHWLVGPTFHREGLSATLLQLTLPLGLGGFWVAAFLGSLLSRPLLPQQDPRFAHLAQTGEEAHHG